MFKALKPVKAFINQTKPTEPRNSHTPLYTLNTVGGCTTRKHPQANKEINTQ